MLVKTYGGAPQGVNAAIITIEVNIIRGARFYLVGLPDNAVKESQFRIESTLKSNGFRMPGRRIIVNLAPADLRKEGSAYDLPLALAILAASEQVCFPEISKYLIMGELSLDGAVKPVRGVLPIAIEARKMRFKGFIVPEQNAREAAVVNNLDIIGVENFMQAVGFLSGSLDIEPTIVDTRNDFFSNLGNYDVDFSDVRGQEDVKRAIEIAAAGGHNVLMIGSPGSGKTMIAQRLPGILPPLTLSEALETTKIHSVAGKMEKNTSLMTRRPFRTPHHTISDEAVSIEGVKLFFFANSFWCFNLATL